VSFALGINNCFAVKRWSAPQEWATIVADELGLDLVQHSFDLVDFSAGDDELEAQAAAVRAACQAHGIVLDSTFTGLAAYSSNLLLAADAAARAWAEAWYEQAIRFTSWTGARSTGGHLGSLSAADFAAPERRRALWSELSAALDRLRRAARAAGLDRLLVENMACAREPSTIGQVEALLGEGDEDRVAVELCLDVGHQCVPGTSGDDRDPYAWLRRLGGRASVVHLQQSDADGDHHWPFTAHYNQLGRIDAARVVRALGAARPSLIIEVIPPFEADDDQVLDDLRETVAYWRAALAAQTVERVG
jgi:D-erythrulose 1-phosphate 3-epimerase